MLWTVWIWEPKSDWSHQEPYWFGYIRERNVVQKNYCKDMRTKIWLVTSRAILIWLHKGKECSSKKLLQRKLKTYSLNNSLLNTNLILSLIVGRFVCQLSWRVAIAVIAPFWLQGTRSLHSRQPSRSPYWLHKGKECSSKEAAVCGKECCVMTLQTTAQKTKDSIFLSEK